MVYNIGVYIKERFLMPKITNDQIEFLPSDRYAIEEQSAGITPATYTTLFNGAIREGETMEYFKFLEEIAEKDADILHALGTRTSNITSKEWNIVNENEEEDATSKKIKNALKEISGDPIKGLLSIDQLINSFLQSAYLIGISMNEIVTDKKKIIGFNHIPAHFLTFNEQTTYPALWTQKTPTGVEFNKEKMIAHYLTSGIDPARGWLGNAISWQYVLKRSNLSDRLQYQNKYGKGFLLVNMPSGADTYEEAWNTAEELIENYSTVDGAVFPGDVMVEFKEGSKLDGQYFFDAENGYKRSIVKIILGQESTSSSEDSNRSTADVHKDIMETRILEDINLIENTLNKQLIPKVKVLTGIAEDSKYEFKFVRSDLEEELDDETDTEAKTDSKTKMVKEEGTE